MLALLKQFDQELFLFLNSLNNPALDIIMYWFSDKLFWVPFYFILLLIIGWKKGWKSLFILIPVVALVIALSDQLSVHLFKDVFKRYRPCHNDQIKETIHIVSGCGGIYGFVSSHAANTFALALFIGLVLKNKFKFILHFMLIWALMVSYSRIYIGVHYPADILVGAMLGILIGCFGFYLNGLITRKINFK
ncbi:MAG: phosphatase PAP2 family protein [Bacteroidetes bacterium]|nr:phosphatase PAP2 family protein [Bacteroidota bacterium]HET6244791.1 phosphatase PAP2 family protein [Bacteroidia bacterium]